MAQHPTLGLDPVVQQEIYDAWNNPGRNPGYHRWMKNELRRDWPVLARALDRMPRPDSQELHAP